MAKSATLKGNRSPQNGTAFLDEEGMRGVLAGGNKVYPRPEYVQPDSGAHNIVGGRLGIFFDPTTRPMKYGNFEKDLNGGYF